MFLDVHTDSSYYMFIHNDQPILVCAYIAYIAFWERKLYNDLMVNYDKNIKPSRDPNKQITVFISFSLSRVESVVRGIVISVHQITYRLLP